MTVWGLDVGTGASCIYPLLGHRVYGWNFMGSDIDRWAVSQYERRSRLKSYLSGCRTAYHRDKSVQRVGVGLCQSSSEFSFTSFVIRTNGIRQTLVNCSIAIKSAKANVERNTLAACIEVKHVARRDYCKPCPLVTS